MHPKLPFDYFRSLTFKRTLAGGGGADRLLSAQLKKSGAKQKGGQRQGFVLWHV